MLGRRSGRSAAARNLASSPPKESNIRQPQTPPRRRTTRSQSADLGETNAIAKTKRAGSRHVRQGSADSVGSNGSATSSRIGRTVKAKAATVPNRKLSMVAEAEQEPEEEEEEEEDEREGLEENNDEHVGLPAQSPGALSQMSGTTAISSFSAMTSRSDAAIRSLDPAIAADLPQLHSTSLKIVNHLAPASASTESVDRIVARLRNPGSNNAIRLRKDEELFKLLFNRFLSGKEAMYLRTPDLLRLFLDREVTEGGFRPDSIIHLANIATMIKEFLVIDRQSQAMGNHQFLLDRWFPELFVESFGDVAKYGQSRLIDEAFEMGLDIRTQFAISALAQGKEDEGWNPELILRNTFLDNSEKPKSIIGMNTTNTESQTNTIEERIGVIRSTFRKGSEAQDRSDLVDFEALEDDLFPWNIFLTNLVSWARLRTDEIKTCIDDQGGAYGITQSLLGIMNLSDSQVEVESEAVGITENQSRLLPAVDIIRGTKGRSLQTPANIKKLKEMMAKGKKRQSPSADEIMSNKRAKTTIETSSRASNLHKARPSTHSATAPSVSGYQDPIVENWRPADGDDDGDLLPLEQALSAAATKGKNPAVEKIKANWNSIRQEKNKENLPVSSSRKVASAGTSATRDSEGERVTWTQRDDEEQEELGPGRNQQQDQSQDSEDDGFQEDQRTVNPERRVAAPVGAAGPLPSHHRQHQQQKSDTEAVAPYNGARRAGRTEQLRQQAHARPQRAAADEEDEGEDEEEAPRPTPREVREHAKFVVSRSKPAQTQTRTAWSQVDEEHLVGLIETYGASYAEIEKQWQGEREVNQVALRDKARNLKVAWLRSGVSLPVGFEYVAMGAKEIRAVRVSRPDYEYLPGIE